MKKLITILFVLFAFTAMSQSIGVTSFVADTTTDSETEYSVLASPRTNGITGNYIITIGVLATETSGTAVVNATPQGSLDGTHYYDLESADTIATGGTSTSTSWEFLNSYWRFYRVKYVSTGSGVNILSGELGIKEKD